MSGSHFYGQSSNNAYYIEQNSKASIMNRALLPLLAATAAVITLNASANPTSGIDEMTIIGSKLDVRKVAGSGAVIDNDQIATEVSTDINQLLKTVSGVYVREEDGYGLRPNFGIRGATSERSEKVTLMEDGVLIAPAPYLSLIHI